MAQEQDPPGLMTRFCRWVSRRLTARRALAVLFLIILLVVHKFTSILPYATLGSDHKEAWIHCFSPDGQALVTAENPGPLRVWDVDRGTEKYSVSDEWNFIKEVCLSPDGKWIAACAEREIKVWDSTTAEESMNIHLGTDPDRSVNLRFSPDSQMLVYQDYGKDLRDLGEISFWDIEGNRLLGSIDGNLWTLAFASDGKSFATFREKGKTTVLEVKFWKMNPKQMPTVVRTHYFSANFFDISPNLDMFATTK